jgi:hypothetical protein
MAGFAAARALSTRNDDPQRASRPWDRDRDGFVLADGAGVLVLEEYEHAKKRVAKIIAEVCGYGVSESAYRITDLNPDGSGPIEAMQMAIDDAGIKPAAIGYVNAHGSGSVLGDQVEARAIVEVFGPGYAFLPKEDLLGFEEIVRLVRVMNGIRPGPESSSQATSSRVPLQVAPVYTAMAPSVSEPAWLWRVTEPSGPAVNWNQTSRLLKVKLPQLGAPGTPAYVAPLLVELVGLQEGASGRVVAVQGVSFGTGDHRHRLPFMALLVPCRCMRMT